MNEYPVFEFLPFESLIIQSQQEYYEALAKSDNKGNSTVFIEYMIDVIDKSLIELLNYNQRILSEIDRLEIFKALGKKEFTRKDYLNIFKEISSATASRDFKKCVEMKFFVKTGSKNLTVYRLLK